MVEIIRRLPIIVLLSVIYFLAGKLGLQLAIAHPSATAVWPPTGIALAALLIFRYDVWPAIFIGAFAVNLTTAGSVATSIGIAAGNTLEGLVGAYLISKFAHGRRAFACVEDVLKFAFLGGVVSTAIAATFGVVMLLAGGFLQGTDRTQVWLTWWLGDMMGAVLVAPCLILWSVRPQSKRDIRAVYQGAIAAFSLLFIGSILFGGFLHSSIQNYPLAFVCIPFVVWTAFHLRAHEVTSTVVALSGIAIMGTLRGFGPFVVSNENHSLLLLQAFMGVIVMTSLVLSAVVSQRNSHQEALKRARDELEARVIERTEQLERRVSEKERAETALRELSSRLLQFQDEERRHIARELHDSTGQELAFLNMSLDHLEAEIGQINPAAAKLLAENSAIVRKISGELRTISHLLHPPLLDEAGLASALRWYVEGFAERSNIKVHTEIPSELDRIGPELETAVFRVVQECLTNIHRHSNSPTASIRLDRASDGIRLEIADEGKGIPPGKQPTNVSAGRAGVGLRGMRERVRQFGGELEISSNGKGTRVTAFFPVPTTETPERVSAEPPSSKAGLG
jgi:signal transduction histidine kinase